MQGSYSDCFEIANSVFQGTVLGPVLWNTFFHDVAAPASSTDGEVAFFADDLTSFKAFAVSIPNDQIISEMPVSYTHLTLPTILRV